jgi:predicted negative regulator of RcsB-dependent stress response
MATLDTHEQEQIDAIKAWWNENRRWLVMVVVVALAAYSAVTYWKFYQRKQSVEASALYAEVMKQVASNDPKRINDSVAVLVDKYAGTAYASRAQLLAAQANVQFRNMDAAQKQLEWVISHASESGLQDTARLKLAAMLLDEKKYDASLKLLNEAHPEAFTGLYSDLKGDVLAAQGKNDEARAAYKLAYDSLDAKSSYRTLVQLKLDALGGAK